jgi:hypothetical protein
MTDQSQERDMPCTHRMRRSLALLTLMLLPMFAIAQPTAIETPWTVGLDAERWTLPADETAGMVGLHLRRAFSDHLRLGVDSFAAVQGQRGGFITLGVGGEFRYPLATWADLEAGLSVSAGCGRGGRELSGGGLLLRESLGVSVPVGAWRWRTGLSHVNFPNGGTIAGTQWYAGVEHRFMGLSTLSPSSERTFRITTAQELTAADLGVYLRPYRVRPGSLTDAGTAQSNFGVVGAEWRGVLRGPWYYTVDAGGAAHGQSNGYMEIMGGIGLRLPLTSTLSVDGGVSVGAGGGGAVDTGGGALLAARVGAQWCFTGRDAVAIGLERMKAPSGHLTVDGVSLSLRHRFGPDEPMTVPADSTAKLQPHPVRIRMAVQNYTSAGSAWATRPIPSIGVLGVQADYDLSDTWYLTGQGLAAYRGESGAYMTGLVGVGAHLGVGRHLYLESEALLGAAGGGGVAVASGAVAQVNVGVGAEWSSGLGLHASVGRIRSLQGSFAANVVGLSVSYRTTLLSGSR